LKRELPKRFYIYKHIRLDNGEVFYVGKGYGYRAWSESGRNSYWRNIVSKCGYRVEIIIDNLTEIKSFEKEKEHISFYKSQNLCKANLTLGGEGISGLAPWNKGKTGVFSEETTQKLRNATGGKNNPFYGKKHTQETKDKISNANKGKTSWSKGKTGVYSEELLKQMSKSHMGYIWKEESKQKLIKTQTGKKHTKQAKLNMSRAQKGRFVSDETKALLSKINLDKKLKGETSFHKTSVIDTKTKKIYPTVTMAAESVGMKRQTLTDQLNGRATKRANLMYLSEYEKLNNKE